ERMRRLRLCARLDAIVHAEFGDDAQRRREAVRRRRASDPGFMLCQAAVMIGPEKLPAEAFDERQEAELAAMR
ncbi:MAG TPA: FAD-dependent monooxygenase, partial [Dehalococcoidia bacterium]|nr:FAD-dependent monooxygenase [Dehalococcoidia bacterium]